jgi:hypothetical protein
MSHSGSIRVRNRRYGGNSIQVASDDEEEHDQKSKKDRDRDGANYGQLPPKSKHHNAEIGLYGAKPIRTTRSTRQSNSQGDDEATASKSTNESAKTHYTSIITDLPLEIDQDLIKEESAQTNDKIKNIDGIIPPSPAIFATTPFYSRGDRNENSHQVDDEVLSQKPDDIPPNQQIRLTRTNTTNTTTNTPGVSNTIQHHSQGTKIIKQLENSLDIPVLGPQSASSYCHVTTTSNLPHNINTTTTKSTNKNNSVLSRNYTPLPTGSKLNNYQDDEEPDYGYFERCTAILPISFDQRNDQSTCQYSGLEFTPGSFMLSQHIIPLEQCMTFTDVELDFICCIFSKLNISVCQSTLNSQPTPVTQLSWCLLCNTPVSNYTKDHVEQHSKYIYRQQFGVNDNCCSQCYSTFDTRAELQRHKKVAAFCPGSSNFYLKLSSISILHVPVNIRLNYSLKLLDHTQLKQVMLFKDFITVYNPKGDEAINYVKSTQPDKKPSLRRFDHVAMVSSGFTVALTADDDTEMDIYHLDEARNTSIDRNAELNLSTTILGSLLNAYQQYYGDYDQGHSY